MTLLTLLVSEPAPEPSGSDVAAVRIWTAPQDGTYIDGDLVRCFAEFRDPEELDSDGKWALVDPTTVTFRVVSPTGATTSASATRISAGLYYGDIDVTRDGVWTYRFEGAGTYKAADEREFAARDSAF